MQQLKSVGVSEQPLTEQNFKAQHGTNALRRLGVSLIISRVPQRLSKQQGNILEASTMPLLSCCYCASADLTGCAKAAAFALYLLNEAVLWSCI